MDFYYITNGANWINSSNWLTGPICTWYGITCGTQGINYIELGNNNLSGPLNESLSNLQQLVSLNLFNNNLTGYIPEVYGNIEYLHSVNFGANHLTGPFPLSFGNNNHLAYIFIDSNDFAGPVPDTIFKSTSVYAFSLSNNHFSSLSYYPNYSYYLDVSGNNLTFKDIVPYCINSSLQSFYYTHQDSILETIDTTILMGSNITFSSWVDSCQNNRYRWRKDYVFITPLDTNSNLHLNNVQLSDAGNYSCFVVNSDAPLLTLYRKVIHLHIVDTGVGLPENNPDKEFQLSYSLLDCKLSIQFRYNTPLYVKCYLYDRLGRKISRLLEGVVGYNKLEYYLNAMRIKPGLYILKVDFGKTIVTKKIIVQ
ncbi:MAG: T9SS type A sorting domain-containing protein [Bacteroidetes bacterium]|nr:T9SS type A sorting domain-containing protein [Bacteroidota bacterium]